MTSKQINLSSRKTKVSSSPVWCLVRSPAGWVSMHFNWHSCLVTNIQDIAGQEAFKSANQTSDSHHPPHGILVSIIKWKQYLPQGWGTVLRTDTGKIFRFLLPTIIGTMLASGMFQPVQVTTVLCNEFTSKGHLIEWALAASNCIRGGSGWILWNVYS